MISTQCRRKDGRGLLHDLVTVSLAGLWVVVWSVLGGGL